MTMKWPEQVRLWLSNRGLYGEPTNDLQVLYSTAYAAMEGAEPKDIIKDCDGKYSTFAFDPVVICPVCEEDKAENEYALALFYTSEIIREYWDDSDADDCDVFPGVM